MDFPRIGERLRNEAPYLDLELECLCGYSFNDRVSYVGEIHPREIPFEGERVYAWRDTPICDKCGIRLHIETRLWTYPDDNIIYIGFEETRVCTVLNKKTIYDKLGFTPAA